MSASRFVPLIAGSISTDRYDPSGSRSSNGSRELAFIRHSSAAPVPAAARQSFQL